MTSTNNLHVVLGGSGAVGGALVRDLVARGRRVRAVNRAGQIDTPAGVEVVAGDITDQGDARRVCAGATVVYLATNPPYTYKDWAAAYPPMMAGAIAGAGAAGARLIYADNLYMYAPTDKPLTEDLPWAPTTRKGEVRARIAETLLAAHRDGRVRAAIGRASTFFGPAITASVVGDRFFVQLLGGKRVEWLGKTGLPHALSYVPDVARGLITLGERDTALGHVWHIPTAEPLTGTRYVALAAAEAGVAPKVVGVSPLMLRMAGLFTPPVREMVEMQYEFLRPYVVDGSAYARAFPDAPAPTPHAESIRATVAWFKAHPEALRAT